MKTINKIKNNRLQVSAVPQQMIKLMLINLLNRISINKNMIKINMLQAAKKQITLEKNNTLKLIIAP